MGKKVFATSLLAALMLGCGTTTPCSSANCSGCCDGTNGCVTQVTVNQCGSFGAACQACRVGESCLLGTCTPPSASGGGAGGGSGGGAGGGGGVSAPQVLEATPPAVSLTGCIGEIATGQFQLTSRASVPLTLDLQLLDAGVFGLGTVASMLAPDASVMVPVTFRPIAAGDQRATVVASGRAMTAAPIDVQLLGSTVNLPPIPTLETGPQRTDRSGYLTCTESSPLSDCVLEFPDTPQGQTASLELRVSNRGCARLSITSIAPEFSGPAGMTVMVVPSVFEVGAGQTATVVVSVTPTTQGSSSAALVIRSNDPNCGDGFTQPARLLMDIVSP